MSKELEALEQSKEIIRKHCEKQPKPCYLMLDLEKPFNEIETELKETKKLKECYKNELKNTAYYNNLALKHKIALEMIKENLVVSYDESKNDKPCLILGIKVSKDNLVVIYETFDKEKIDLLKEVLE